MDNLMQRALGSRWAQLPPALQAHYLQGADGMAVDRGHMDVSYPRFMQPALSVLRWVGALVPRRGAQVATTVLRRAATDRLHWQRTLTFADGEVVHFNSAWEPGPHGSVIEFVNPLLGLEMKPFVEGAQLRYEGLRFVLRLGGRLFTLPEWLLGHTTIVEEAVDDTHFRMDFRMTHPVAGEVFRYAGVFAAGVSDSQ